MRRPGPVLLAVGALLMIVGGVGHFGIVWAVGVVLAAGGLAALVAPRSRVAGLALAVVLIAGLVVYPWLAERSATTAQSSWDVRAGQPGVFGLVATGGRVLELDGSEAYLLDAKTGHRLRNAGVSAALAFQALDGSFFVVEHGTLTAYDRDGRRRWRRAGSVIGPFAAAGDTALVTTRDGVRAVDAQGRVRWTRPRAKGRYIELARQLPADQGAAPRLLPDLAVVSVSAPTRTASRRSTRATGGCSPAPERTASTRPGRAGPCCRRNSPTGSAASTSSPAPASGPLRAPGAARWSG